SRFTTDDDREWWARSGAWILLTLLVWLAFSFAVLYGPDLFRDAVAKIAAAGGIAGIVASRLGFSSQTGAGPRSDQPAGALSGSMGSRLRSYALKLAAPTFIVLMLLLVAIFDDWLLKELPDWLRAVSLGAVAGRPVSVVLVAMALLLLPAFLLAILININVFSLHGMYRSRLIRAYLGASNPKRRPNPFTGFDVNDSIPMADIGRQRAAPRVAGQLPIERPIHVVNMALNLVESRNLAWQQRKAESFTATTLHAGSCRVGYQPTEGYGDGRRPAPRSGGMDLGTAITISGAAASPNMGYNSSPIVTMLMALFNARLGSWLPNPGPQGRRLWRLSSPLWAVTPWVHEAFGLTTD